MSLVHAFIIKDPRVYDERLNDHSDEFILTAKSLVYYMVLMFPNHRFTIPVFRCPLNALFFVDQDTFLKPQSTHVEQFKKKPTPE